MRKMKSPSYVKFVKILDTTMELINSYVFSSNKVKRELPKGAYLFIGNTQHAYTEFKHDGYSEAQAKLSAYALAKIKMKTDFKINDNINDIIEHNIKFANSFLSRNNVKHIELRTYWVNQYESIFNDAIGGTADIVIENNDGSYTIADFKNYQNPNNDDLAKHYYQCLIYANLIKDQEGVEIKDIKIVYPSQEDIVSLPYQDIELDKI
tara:strand:- start:5522 stop:6145 length:624 start_codon:yes stop_codon:yes gene_type:complete